MGEEYHPLMGLGGGDELSLIWEPVRDIVGQVSDSLSFLTSPSVTEETIHFPPAPDMVGEG